MKHLQRFLSVFLVLLMLFSLGVNVFAEETDGVKVSAGETALQTEPEMDVIPSLIDPENGQISDGEYTSGLSPGDEETDTEETETPAITIEEGSAAEVFTEEDLQNMQTGEPSKDDVITYNTEDDAKMYYLSEEITFDENMDIVSDEVYESDDASNDEAEVQADEEQPAAEDGFMLLSDGNYEDDTSVGTTITTTGEKAWSEISSTYNLYGSASTSWYSWNGTGWTKVNHGTGVPERVHWLHTSSGWEYVAYCIEPWKNSSTTSSYVYTSSSTAITNTLSAGQKKSLALVLLYGYSYSWKSGQGYVYHSYYAKNSWAFYGTQMLVWEILASVRNCSGTGLKYFNRINSSNGYNSGSDVFAGFYNKTVSSYSTYFASWAKYRAIAEMVHFHGQIPSFTYNSDEEADENAIQLSYNESTGKYEATVHNTNEVLNDNYDLRSYAYSSYYYSGVTDVATRGSYWLKYFNYYTDYDDGITFSQDSAGNLTISMDASVAEELRNAGESTVDVDVETPSAKTDDLQVKVWNVSNTSLQQMVSLTASTGAFEYAHAYMTLAIQPETTEEYGSIKITKEGSYTATTVSDDGTMFFHEYSQSVPGTEFLIENVTELYDANGRVMYEAGAYTQTVTTGEDGTVTADFLPVGTYKITETKTADGYIVSTASKEVTAEADTTAEVTFFNKYQSASVSVTKKSSDTDKPLSGAVFGLYAAEDIYFGDNLIFEADSRIEGVTTDDEGSAFFVANIPVGYSYYILEEQPPDGYTIGEESRYEFTAEYDADVETVTVTHEFRDDPATGDLSLSKRLTCEITEPQRQFSFTVTLTPPEDYTGAAFNKTCSVEYSMDGNTSAGNINFIDGVSTVIRLCADQTVVIHGLPAGWSYSITEDEDTMGSYSLYEWENQRGTIAVGETAQAVCTNTRNVWDNSNLNLPNTGSNGLQRCIIIGMVLAGFAMMLIAAYIWLDKKERDYHE